jgi:methylaspartate mutase sigma subunit
MSDMKKSATLVMGVIGEDVHVVGIRILEYALSDAGFKVVSLGAQVSQEEFIEAAIETKADAILVSSYSGHAESLSTGFRDKCNEAGLNNIVLLIGGYLLQNRNLGKRWKRNISEWDLRSIPFRYHTDQSCGRYAKKYFG